MKTVYFGGPILTMEETSPEAVLTEDGIIQKLGTAAELCAIPGVRLHDLQGRTMMPAFLDAHSHLTATAQTLAAADLTGADSFAEIVRRLKAHIERSQPDPGQWIVGFGYDNNILAEKRHPDKALLDTVTDRPVLISHASGHMGAVNSAALAAMQVTADTPDPEGGRIGRMPGSSEPSGFLEETAFTNRTSHAPRMTVEQQLRLLRGAEDIYLKNGITTIQDGLTRNPEWELLKAASDRNLLRTDVVCYPDAEQNADLLEKFPEYTKDYQNNLKIGGCKMFLDGSPQGRTAWMSKPYEGAEDGYRGYPVHPTEQVAELIKKSLRENFQLLAHCNGDAAAEQYISCFEEAILETGRKPLRPVMIHAQLVRRDQLPRMAKIGMIPSFFTAHSWYWGDVHLQNFGTERASGISPARSAGKAGLPYTFHQDTPVIQPNVIETIWCAVNRRTRNGQSLDGGESITVKEALKAVTLHTAAQYGEENKKGSIREGKRADFVILSENPLEVPPEELRRIRVTETIREDETLFQDK